MCLSVAISITFLGFRSVGLTLTGMGQYDYVLNGPWLCLFVNGCILILLHLDWSWIDLIMDGHICFRLWNIFPRMLLGKCACRNMFMCLERKIQDLVEQGFGNTSWVIILCDDLWLPCNMCPHMCRIHVFVYTHCALCILQAHRTCCGPAFTTT